MKHLRKETAKKGWSTKVLADVCQLFTDGNWIESKDQSPSGIRLVQTGNIGEGVFKDRGDKARYISEATFRRLRCTEILEGDCLISRLPDPVGRSCILPDTGERMITAVDCTIVRFDQKQFLPAFFTYYSQTRDYLKAINAAATGTTRSRISRKNLGSIPVPIPPLDEQLRIVELLDEATELTNLRSEADIRTDFLIPALFHEMFGVPLSESLTYPVKKLGELVRDGDKINYGVVQPGDEVSGGIPIVRAGDFNGMMIDKQHLKRISPEIEKQYSRSRLRGDEILISCVGSIGYVALADSSLAGFNIVRAVARVPLCDEIDRVFVANQLMTPELQNFFRNETRTVAQPTLNIKQIQEAPIIIPPLGLQKEFAARVNEIRAVQAEQAISRAGIDALFQSMLHRAFSGEI
jgi:type I restriction enzyme, S subunit